MWRNRSGSWRAGLALAVLGALFIIGIGCGHLFAGSTMATGFGLPDPPAGDAGGFFVIKGVRDLATGLLLFALLAARQWAAVPVVMAVFAVIPLGDAVNVIAHRGSVGTALRVHALTTALMLVAAALLTRGRPVAGVPAKRMTPTMVPLSGVSGGEVGSRDG